LLTVPLVAEAWAAVTARCPDVAAARLIPELVRDLIGRMVNDVLAETIARAGQVASPEAVRDARRQLAGFSPDMAARERVLKRFLYTRMYDAPEVKAVRVEGQAILAKLFAAYRADPALLPEEWQPDGDDPVARVRRIGDFIAGMTDRYAVRQYEALIGPTPIPEGF